MTIPLKGNWNYPTAIRFGAGRVAELPQACAEAGMKRPLVVTDPGLAKLEPVAKARALLRGAKLGDALFSELRGNPVAKNVEDGVAALRAGKHDGVVAIGGGSALDVGKVIAFMAGQTRPMWDFEDVGDWWTRADPTGIAPVVAVPTTAGTGSETGRAGVITDERSHVKKIIFHPKMMPRVVIADPELTVGLPPRITAATGMDAFAHLLEAYCAPFHHPYADGIAVEGMRLVKENLARAVKHGGDLEARAHMLAASQMGSTAFQKGLGAIHSLSHPAGAVLDTHHGLTNAVVMPYVLLFNRPAIEAKIVRLARWLGLARPDFDGFMDFVLALRREIGIPHTMAELGVKPEHLDRFSAMAAEDPTAGGNPVKAGVPEMRRMYEAAVAGRLWNALAGEAAAAFVALFVILDPPGTAAVFAGLMPRASGAERRTTARRAVAIAAIVLVLFAIGGHWLLGALGVGLPAFRIAGGVLLFLIAVDMVFSHQLGFRDLTGAEKGEARTAPDISVFPLAIPLIAGPGALTTMVLLTGRAAGDPARIAALLATLAAVLAITYALLVTADAVARRLGATGVNVVSRVLGILLAAIATQLVIDGALAALGRVT